MKARSGSGPGVFRFLRPLLVAGIVAGIVGGSAAVVSGAAVAASDLEERVEKRLDDHDGFNGLDVDVVDGKTVILRGEVASSAQKARAERLARAAGAENVVNKLEIDADKAARRIDDVTRARKERIEDRAERQKEAVERQAEAAKERLDRRDRQVATEPRHRDTHADERRADDRRVDDRRVDDRRVDDGRVDDRRADDRVVDPMVTARVKTSIGGDDRLNDSNIDVDTNRDGVVTLRGTVASEADRARAVDIARRTDGVRRVVDALSVRAPVERR